MEKKRFFAGMSAAVLVFGMAVAGCDNGSTNNDDREKLPSTDGLLTVTGLSEYNGKYILVTQDSSTMPILVGFDDFNKATKVLTLTLISNGKADVKIYVRTDASYNMKGYSGSDTVTLGADIWNNKTFYTQQTNSTDIFGEVSATFVNGKATAAFTLTGGGGGGGGGQSSVKKTVGR